MNSGRMIFRLGRYHECIADDRMDYQFVTVGREGGGPGMYIGLCLPK